MVDTTIAGPTALREFRIGGAIRAGIALYRAHFLFFIGTSLVPLLLAGAITASIALLDAGMAVVTTAGVVSFGLCLLLSFGMQVDGGFRALNGEPIQVKDSLINAISRIFPVLGAVLLASLAMGIGYILLIAPGLILATMFYVVVPICLIEEKGPVDCLRRSAELSKGYRWRLFALILIVSIVPSAILQVIEVLIGLVAGQTAANIASLAGLALLPLYSIATTVIYHALRTAKEGIGTERLTEVFA